MRRAPRRFFLGAGAYRRHIPASVDHLIQRSEFLTSYTPYQPEIAQGTLQVLFEFQTQVAALTGMEVANASMYDGSTACGEAMLMAHRLTRRRKAVLSGGLHPHYAEVSATLAHMADDTIVRLAAGCRRDAKTSSPPSMTRTSCVIVQSPDFFGNPRDLGPIAAAAHARGALLIAVFTDPVALAAVRAPGEMDADIAVGEGQGFGNALNFGGPYVGLFATRMKNVRQMPGRLAGETVDAARPAKFRPDPLDARAAHPPGEGDEQHLHQLRPLRARFLDPSDACSASAGSVSWLKSITPTRFSSPTCCAPCRAFRVLNTHFFNEFTLRTPRPAAELIEALARRGVIGGSARFAASAGRRARRLPRRRQHRGQHRPGPGALCGSSGRVPAITLWGQASR